MSAGSRIVAGVIVLAIIAVSGYWLISMGTDSARGGDSRDEGGTLGSGSIRTVVTLTVVGGSAFITGFGLRDVIGRAVAARQRNRMKSMQHQIRQ